MYDQHTSAVVTYRFRIEGYAIPMVTMAAQFSLQAA